MWNDWQTWRQQKKRGLLQKWIIVKQDHLFQNDISIFVKESVMNILVKFAKKSEQMFHSIVWPERIICQLITNCNFSLQKHLEPSDLSFLAIQYQMLVHLKIKNIETCLINFPSAIIFFPF